MSITNLLRYLRRFYVAVLLCTLLSHCEYFKINARTLFYFIYTFLKFHVLVGSCNFLITPRQKYHWKISFRFKYDNFPLSQNVCINAFPMTILMQCRSYVCVCCELYLIPWNFNEFGLKFQLLNILSTRHVLSGSRPQSLTTRLS